MSCKQEKHAGLKQASLTHVSQDSLCKRPLTLKQKEYEEYSCAQVIPLPTKHLFNRKLVHIKIFKGLET